MTDCEFPNKEIIEFAQQIGPLLEKEKYEKIIEITKKKLIEKQNQPYKNINFINSNSINEFSLHTLLYTCYDKLQKYDSAFKEINYQLDAIEISGLKKIFSTDYINTIEKRFEYMTQHPEILTQTENDKKIINEFKKYKNEKNNEGLYKIINNTENNEIKLTCYNNILQNKKTTIHDYHKACEKALQISIKNKNKYAILYFSLKILEKNWFINNKLLTHILNNHIMPKLSP